MLAELPLEILVYIAKLDRKVLWLLVNTLRPFALFTLNPNIQAMLCRNFQHTHYCRLTNKLEFCIGNCSSYNSTRRIYHRCDGPAIIQKTNLCKGKHKLAKWYHLHQLQKEVITYNGKCTERHYHYPIHDFTSIQCIYPGILYSVDHGAHCEIKRNKKTVQVTEYRSHVCEVKNRSTKARRLVYMDVAEEYKCYDRDGNLLQAEYYIDNLCYGQIGSYQYCKVYEPWYFYTYRCAGHIFDTYVRRLKRVSWYQNGQLCNYNQQAAVMIIAEIRAKDELDDDFNYHSWQDAVVINYYVSADGSMCRKEITKHYAADGLHFLPDDSQLWQPVVLTAQKFIETQD